MPLDPAHLMGFHPPCRVVLDGPAAAVAWARQVPGVGFEPEIFALFLDPGHGLVAAWWLGSEPTVEDLAAEPSFLLTAARSYAAAAVIVLVGQPGEGADPVPADIAVWNRLALAHDEDGVPLLDIVLLDGHHWRSVADADW